MTMLPLAPSTRTILPARHATNARGQGSSGALRATEASATGGTAGARGIAGASGASGASGTSPGRRGAGQAGQARQERQARQIDQPRCGTPQHLVRHQRPRAAPSLRSSTSERPGAHGAPLKSSATAGPHRASSDELARKRARQSRAHTQPRLPHKRLPNVPKAKPSEGEEGCPQLARRKLGQMGGLGGELAPPQTRPIELNRRAPRGDLAGHFSSLASFSLP